MYDVHVRRIKIQLKSKIVNKPCAEKMNFGCKESINNLFNILIYLQILY